MKNSDINDGDNAIAGPRVGNGTARTSILFSRTTGSAIILFVLLDGAVELMSWPIVAQAMDRLGHGSSDWAARLFGAINLICAAAYALPPTSFVNAILTAGYLEHAMLSHMEIGRAVLTLGLDLCVVLLGAVWLRDRQSRIVAPIAG